MDIPKVTVGFHVSDMLCIDHIMIVLVYKVAYSISGTAGIGYILQRKFGITMTSARTASTFGRTTLFIDIPLFTLPAAHDGLPGFDTICVFVSKSSSIKTAVVGICFIKGNSFG